MVTYTIHVEQGCRILRDKKLLLQALEQLPSDARLGLVHFDHTGGAIEFMTETRLGNVLTKYQGMTHTNDLYFNVEERTTITLSPRRQTTHKY